MEELDKDYQQVVRTLTKLEENTGIKKSNFYVLPNSKDQAITFGLFLPNQQKEDGLKADINVNFASFKSPEGDFDNYKEFEKAFIEELFSEIIALLHCFSMKMYSNRKKDKQKVQELFK